MNAPAQKIVFSPAVLEAVNLILGIAGGTGSGKTYSAMRLASGMSRGKPFAVVDTERGRAKHYAREFRFDHHDLRPPFRPEAFARAVLAADNAGYPAIVVDSASHEWAGEGGILDWQEEELDRMAGDDWEKRDRVKMAAWIKPKVDHKKMVQRLLQVRAHLVLCFRAEEKVEMVKGDDGRMKIVPKVSKTGLDGWIPICEKSLPYELTASFLLTNDAPGMPKPIKLQQQHRALFPLDQPLDEKSGERIAEWAAGGSSPVSTAPTVADYDACRDRAALEALERRRQEHWGRMSTEQKRVLKQASDAASARVAKWVDTTTQPAVWIDRIRACNDAESLERLWVEVGVCYHGREIPIEVEDAYRMRKEALTQL